MTAAGQPPEAKIAIATEAYVALHPRGVTGDRFAVKDSNPKNLLSIVRTWLAINPLTGGPCLPYAKSAGRRAPRSTDLPARSSPGTCSAACAPGGEAQGADGIADLAAALDLVSGTPLIEMRSGGGSWLADDTVADHNVMCAAIVDVANVVARALDEADVNLVRRAAETAVSIESGSAWPLLGLAAVCEAEGRTAELSATAHRIVTHHGAVVEEDVPKVTYDVWSAAAGSRSHRPDS